MFAPETRAKADKKGGVREGNREQKGFLWQKSGGRWGPDLCVRGNRR